MKRGIFGGTFNPIHNGHINLALSAIEQSGLDVLTIVPAGNPYHKSLEGVVDFNHRLNMCRIAFEDYPNIEISSIDNTCENSYTFKLLSKFKALYPDDTFVFLLGSDMLINLDKWKNSNIIFDLTEIHCLIRDKKNLDLVYTKAEEYKKLGAKITFIESEVIEISSSEVRKNIDLFKEDIPCKVYDYICQNSIFEKTEYDFTTKIEEIKKDMKILLSDDRYIHSINVADAALKLAEKYNVDKELSYLAALSHDICKNVSEQEMFDLILKSDIIWDSAMLNQKNILHGLASAEYLWHQKGIYNLDIINAVRYHTIAREDMSKLEMLIFVADLISKERDYPDLDKMREAAYTSLEDGMRYALRFILPNLVERKLPICKYTIAAYNFYCTY